jgi:hypothetical protein
MMRRKYKKDLRGQEDRQLGFVCCACWMKHAEEMIALADKWHLICVLVGNDLGDRIRRIMIRL